MIRLAAVGTSNITRSFLGGCKKTEQYTLQAVVSRKAETGEAFAKSFGGATVYTDLDEMLRDETVDAVYIATPNSLHVEQSLKALRAGKHVICEKPLATEVRLVRQLYDEAQQNGVIFTEAIMPAHLPQLRILRDLIIKIGKVQSATLNFKQYSSRYDDFKAGIVFPVFDPTYQGGALNDLGIYNVYTAHLLFGAPRKVTATQQLLSNGVDGLGNATLFYDGFEATLSYSKIDNHNPESHIVGEHGTIKLGSVSKLTDIYLNGAHLFGDMDKETLMSYEAAAFARMIAGDTAAHDTAKALCLSVYETMENLHKECSE